MKKVSGFADVAKCNIDPYQALSAVRHGTIFRPTSEPTREPMRKTLKSTHTTPRRQRAKTKYIGFVRLVIDSE